MKYLNPASWGIKTDHLYLFIEFIMQRKEYDFHKTMQEIILEAMNINPTSENIKRKMHKILSYSPYKTISSFEM